MAGDTVRTVGGDTNVNSVDDCAAEKSTPFTVTVTGTDTGSAWLDVAVMSGAAHWTRVGDT